MIEATYLRVKNWGKFQHYRDKEPGWIKLYSNVIRDSLFLELEEPAQWQLVRVWVAASQSSRHCLDDEGRRVPVVPDDELYLRRAISTVKKLPLARFIHEGWLIPVAAGALLDEAEPSPALDDSTSPRLDGDEAPASSLAKAGATARSSNRGAEQEKKQAKQAAAHPRQHPNLLRRLDELRINGGLRVAAFADADRALACIEKAIAEAGQNPAGYFRTLLESGDWPTEAPVKPPPLSDFEIVQRQIANGAITDRPTLEAELRARLLSGGEEDELRALIPETEEVAA